MLTTLIAKDSNPPKNVEALPLPPMLKGGAEPAKLSYDLILAVN
jgi:hypothetical protein